MAVQMEKAMAEQMKGLIRVEAAYGFMLAVGLFAAGIFLNIIALVQFGQRPAPDSS